MVFPRIFALFLILPFSIPAQLKYSYKIDLKNIRDDQVDVELLAPGIKEDVVIFSFPKVIPGSYSEKDFGRFIENFKAFNKAGKLLKVHKLNANQFEISKAQSLHKLTYVVNDTWDSKYDNFVFQPGGSNIDNGKNVVLNNHAFFGYFENYKMLPFDIRVIKPSSFYGATNLTRYPISADEDILSAENYIYLADNPVLYASPDTTSFIAGSTIIHVSVYSASGKITSSKVAGYLKPMCAALARFFNGLPISSYQFLFFFDDPNNAAGGKEPGGYGALEHNYCSLYYLPEILLEKELHSMVNEVTSHEFLHIQTPLNLHSKEIGDFDFSNPKMSQHLWLYEGVTEYFANLVQVQNGLLDEEGFFSNMHNKINDAEEYGNFSMTEMSKNVLKDEYKSRYASVYNKGALTGFMLDLFIRDKTHNEKELKTVIKTLSEKYGPYKPFNDDELFDEFVRASHPDVQEFIELYIKGANPLPFSEMLATIGYEFALEKGKNVYYIGGNLSLRYDASTTHFVFTDVKKNVLNITNDDVLLSINHREVTQENFDRLWKTYFTTNTTEPTVSIVVRRNNKEQILSGEMLPGYIAIKNYLGPVNRPSPQQLASLAKLLGKEPQNH